MYDLKAGWGGDRSNVISKVGLPDSQTLKVVSQGPWSPASSRTLASATKHYCPQILIPGLKSSSYVFSCLFCSIMPGPELAIYFAELRVAKVLRFGRSGAYVGLRVI